MQITVSFSEEALRVMSTVQDKAAAGVERGIELLASRLRDGMKEYATAGHPDHPNVITGTLYSHIVYLMNGDGFNSSADVGVESPASEYATFVEYGHSQEPGRYVPAIGKSLVASWVKEYPFFRPAVLDFQEGYAENMFNDIMKESLGI